MKDEIIRVRVTADEKAAIEAAAARDGLDVSAWLRQLALRSSGALPAAQLAITDITDLLTELYQRKYTVTAIKGGSYEDRFGSDVLAAWPPPKAGTEQFRGVCAVLALEVGETFSSDVTTFKRIS